MPESLIEQVHLDALIRHHGANEIIDALLRVAGSLYGPQRAVEKVHEFVLIRAGRVTNPPGSAGDARG